MKKMRKRNDGETLWAYINEWLKQYWWLSLIIQAILSFLYCTIVYLFTKTFPSECVIIIIFSLGLMLVHLTKLLHMKLKSPSFGMNFSFLTFYILFNITQLACVFRAIL